MPASEPFRSLPKVDRVLQETILHEPLSRLPRQLVVALVQEEVESLRSHVASSAAAAPPSRDAAQRQVAERVRARLEALLRPSLCAVINATGVVLHTNLGRALLGDAAVEALVTVARRYVNLEYDLERGERTSRQGHVEELLCRLSGAEAALTVNNNAAALLLAVDTLGQAGVVVSRGEQVEIGDSFRLPDILRKSGVPIHEVGTTNRTGPEDYERAAVPGCVLLKVHRSNFTVQGFTRETSVAELVEVAARVGATVVYDLGSGSFEALDAHGLPGEPDVRSALRSGAHVVTMSGDKLLGGPQAGILAGCATAITAMRRNPWARAVRIDKLNLAALQATLLSYAHDGARDVPTRRLLLSEPATIRQRAERLYEALQRAGGVLDLELAPGQASVGGGSFADLQLPSFEVRLRPRRTRATALLVHLRRGSPPVLARIKDDFIALDARCVADDEVEPLAAAVLRAVAAAGEDT